MARRSGLLEGVADAADQFAAVVPIRGVRVAVSERVTPDPAARRQIGVGDAPTSFDPRGDLRIHFGPHTDPEIEVEQSIAIRLASDVEPRVDLRMGRRPTK